MDIDQLNKNHGIPGIVNFVKGQGNLPFIIIRNQNATAVISLHGGQILSFKPSTQITDMLFLSKKSSYEDGKAIRGGIPVCWPWFGPDPKGLQRPNHGFVRTHLWKVINTTSTDNETKISLQFIESQKKDRTWKQPFTLILEFTIASELSLKLTTHNTGDKPFSFTQAFHTYFRVGVINQIQVTGLEGCSYFDKLDQGKEKTQAGIVTIAEEVDRIYQDVNNHVCLIDPALNRRIKIVSQNCKTGVVWNPWQKTSRKMADLGNQDYKHFVCVETGNIAFDLIQIPPDGEHSLFTTFKLLVT
jgi:glucose-6-phosphate 1-epimerase